ncbi:MAG: bifunctional acetate--CoA ligase family protein/GNAT family N-acetyltransferase [Rhodanobacter sp.]|jgi:acetyltransferase|nr:bifunctional acetate--CoA ligase family protein/GNAT family N-acetyltransferase [Rhodanobacter sp.]
MSVRNLEFLFQPRSVAVIGASNRPDSIGALLMHNLRQGGFEGPVWPVNHRQKTVAGMRAWRAVSDLPEAPELALICTPPATVPAIVAELGRIGTRAVVVFTAGLQASGQPDGSSDEQKMLDAAKPYVLRIIGPNSMGMLATGVRLNASFSRALPLPGTLAFVSQSGAMAAAMLDWASMRGIGFSHFVSLGDGVDVDFGDMLDYLASDAGTRAILLYVESLRVARKFMSAARAAARNKPVIVVKPRRAPEPPQAGASHMSALADADAVFDAAIRRAGMLRVSTLSDLFDAAETLARVHRLYGHGQRLAILANGGGASMLAADALSLGRGELVSLSETTYAALDAVLPSWSRGNPVDIIGGASPEHYLAAFDVLQKAPEVDAILFMHATTAAVPSAQIAKTCLPALKASSKPVLCCWLGGRAVTHAQRHCSVAGIPTYDTPERAVRAFLQILEYRRNQRALREVPAAVADDFVPDVAQARAIITQALDAGRCVLGEPRAKQLLGLYGIPVLDTQVAADASQAVVLAEAIGFPVVLKILSPDIAHKSDVSGVALNLSDALAVRKAAQAMLCRVHELRPDARIDGIMVQAMVQRPRAHELIVGMTSDAVLGPVLVFGQGGTATELIHDRTVALPPLNRTLARHVVDRTRVARLLASYRDRPPVDHEALYQVLVRVSQLVCDLHDVVEMDINPLLADEHGVLALDARVRLERNAVGTRRLAIRPYPSALEQTVILHDQTLLLRPIRPEDADALRDFYVSCAPDDMRLRFFTARRDIPLSELARYTQIDYDREMTFVAFACDADGRSMMMGEVRVLCDPDNVRAEFAVQVRSGIKQKGLGRLLMQRMIDYLRARHTRELVGECLPENDSMQRLARAVGMTVHRDNRMLECVMHLDLQGEEPPTSC